MAFPSDPELALELYLDTLKAVVKSFPTIVDLGAFTRTVLRNIANRIRRESAQKRTTDDGGEGKNVSCDDPDEPELGLNADGTPWRSSQRELSTAEEQVLEDLGTDPEERMQHQDELRGQQEEREEQSLCTAREEFVARVHEAVQQLPESVQRVAEKLYVEGRTPQEAADELQLKPGTFRQYRKRARDGIRARLTERFQGTRIPTILPLDEWLDILLRQPKAIVNWNNRE
jgi:RNA polymerase sigma factor (sigma-70 family)